MEVNRQRFLIRLMTGALCGTLLGSSARAEGSGAFSKTQFVLQGLHTVVVVGEQLEPETVEAGITREWLRDLTLAKLKRAGIHAVTEEQVRHSNGFIPPEFPSALGIFVDADRDPTTGLYSGFYRLVLLDSAILVRHPKAPIPVTTWLKEGSIRPSTRRGFKRAVAEITSDSLNQFVRLYHNANGRSVSSHH